MHADGVDDWISLGNLSHISCLVKPKTCRSDGFLGAAILLWFKTADKPSTTGILSSFEPGIGLSSGISFTSQGLTLEYVHVYSCFTYN